jgi:hypothetical protein
VLHSRVAVAAALAATVIAAAPAQAAPSLAPQVHALQLQMKALQKRTTALEKQVTTLKKDIATSELVAGASLILQRCTAAANADLFQATWSFLDIGRTPPYFGAQTPVDDGATCADLKLTRPGTTQPPNVGFFTSVVALLG